MVEVWSLTEPWNRHDAGLFYTMALVSLQEISIAFDGPPLLDGVSLQIDKQQRIGLLGRNGTGKSTLMKILAGQVVPDAGTVQAEAGLKIAYFSQTIPPDLDGSVFEVIARGLGQRGEWMVRYHREEARRHPGSHLHISHCAADACFCAEAVWRYIGNTQRACSGTESERPLAVRRHWWYSVHAVSGLLLCGAETEGPMRKVKCGFR